MVHFYNVGSFYGKYQLMNLLVVNIYMLVFLML
jgi:hypothetical protein